MLNTRGLSVYIWSQFSQLSLSIFMDLCSRNQTTAVRVIFFPLNCFPHFIIFSAISFILLRCTKFSSIKVYRIRHVRNTDIHLPVCWLLLWRNVPQFVACPHIYEYIHRGIYLAQRMLHPLSCWGVCCARTLPVIKCFALYLCIFL